MSTKSAKERKTSAYCADRVHMISVDGTNYEWCPDAYTKMFLGRDEIRRLIFDVKKMTDNEIQNDDATKGKLGVPVPFDTETIGALKSWVLETVKRQAEIIFSKHARGRIGERGWSSEEEVEKCVYSIERVDQIDDEPRIRVDKKTVNASIVKFHASMNFKITGVKPDGSIGNVALVVVGDDEIIIITLLPTN